MITKAPASSQNQIQESAMVGNVSNQEEIVSQNRGTDAEIRSIQLCCDASPHVADLMDSARSTASFHLDFIEKSYSALIRKIKYEAKNHCDKLRATALNEMIHNKKPSSEVRKEFYQMVAETLDCMNEQLDKVKNSKKRSVLKMKNDVLKEVADKLEESLEPKARMLFDHKAVGALASLCHSSVMTLHVFLGSFAFFGACVLACRHIPLYF